MAERGKQGGKKSLLKFYLNFLLLINLSFALSGILVSGIALYLYGTFYIESKLKHLKTQLNLSADKFATELLYELQGFGGLGLSTGELKEEKRRAFLQEVEKEIEELGLKGVLRVYEAASKEKPTWAPALTFKYEPLEIELNFYFPRGYCFIWYLSRLLFIFLTISLAAIAAYFIQKKVLGKITKGFERISRELEKGARVSPMGYEELDNLIYALNKAIEKERELMEKMSLQQKMVALGTLAGGYAHEFNNILQIISANLELMKLHLEKKECEKAINLMEKTRGTLLRGQTLARKFLQLTRTTETESVNLKAFLEENQESYQVMLGKRVELHLHTPKEALHAPLSEDSLGTIMINLLRNAADALEEKRLKIGDFQAKVEIVLQREGERAFLMVKDNGLGMTEEVKRRLFEPFFTTKDRTKGTGLGLYTIFNLVQNAGGEIEVESEYLLGTTFKVYLPLLRLEERPEEKPTPKEEEKGVLYQKVLVVDDEEEIREVLAEVLRMHGVEVEVAENGERALQLILEKPFDLCLLDMFMPEKGGDYVLEKTKELPQAPKFVLMTGFAGEMEETIKKAYEEGRIIRILRKPFSLEEIVKILTGGGGVDEI